MPQGVECSFAVVSDGWKFYSTFTKTMSIKIFQSYIYKKSTHLYTHTHVHTYVRALSRFPFAFYFSSFGWP